MVNDVLNAPHDGSEVDGAGACASGVLMSDGSGYIGAQLAEQLYRHLQKEEPTLYGSTQVPSVFQVRCWTQLGAFKGTLAVRDDLDPDVLFLRPSMKKLPPSDRFDGSDNVIGSGYGGSGYGGSDSNCGIVVGDVVDGGDATIEVVGISTSPRATTMNRQLLLVLASLEASDSLVQYAESVLHNLLRLVSVDAADVLAAGDGPQSESLEEACFRMLLVGKLAFVVWRRRPRGMIVEHVCTVLPGTGRLHSHNR
jgi:hypothetical protein